nr:DUF4915 domain-containing protein [Roseococcus sp. SDR]
MASFCNTGHADGRFSLGMFTWSAGAPVFEGFVDLGGLHRRLGFTGITGLCVENGRLHAGLQRTPSALATFDLTNGTAAAVELTQVRKLHSICTAEQGLLLVSTGTNRIIHRNRQDGTETPAHVLDPAEHDTLHLNGIAMRDGQPLVAMFGPALPGDSRRFGEVRDLRSGQALVDRLHTPHSVVMRGDEVLVLESGSGQLLRTRPGGSHDVLRSLFGWVRGLLVTPEALFVGRSGFRAKSASLGPERSLPVSLLAGMHEESERSAIYVLAPDGQAAAALDTSDICDEIYDLVELDPSACLPLMAAEETALLRARRRRDGAALLALAAILPPLPAAEARLAAAEQAGDTRAALLAAEDAARLAPADPTWPWRASELAGQAGDGAAALQHAGRAAALAPNSVAMQLALAARALQEGALATAEGAVRQALELEPRGAAIHAMNAQLREAQGDLTGAAAALEALLDITPAARHAARLGRIYLSLGRREEAERLLDAEQEADITDPMLLTDRARAALAAGEPAHALRLARRAVALAPGRLGLLLLQARAAGEAGETEEARAAFQAVIARQPSLVEAVMGLARLEIGIGRKDLAAKVLRAGLTAKPDHPKILALLAKIERRAS